LLIEGGPIGDGAGDQRSEPVINIYLSWFEELKRLVPTDGWR